MVYWLLFKDLSSNICCLEARRETQKSKHCSLFIFSIYASMGFFYKMLQCLSFLFVCRKLQPSSRERTKALTSAISEILWRAGDNKDATVAL